MKCWLSLLVATAVFTMVGSVEISTCNSPEEVVEHYNMGAVCIVSPCVYSRIISGVPNATDLTRPNEDWAYISGHNAIQAALLARAKDPDNAKAAVLLLAGFGAGPYIDEPYDYYVFDGCQSRELMNSQVLTPTASEWVLLLGEEYNVSVGVPALIGLVESGPNFQSLTGCNPRCAMSSAFYADNDTCGCSQDFLGTYLALQPYAPYSVNGSTAACFAALPGAASAASDAGNNTGSDAGNSTGSEAGGSVGSPLGLDHGPSAAAVRAALYQCQGANPLNTLNGLSFDGVNYTEPEFIVRNTEWETMRAAGVDVAMVTL